MANRTPVSPMSLFRLSLLALSLFVAGGCDDGSVAAAPSAPSPTATSSTVVMTFSVNDAVIVALQDEYHAEAIYRRILIDFGNVNPFANIIRAEQMHASSLAALLRTRGLAVPVSEWNADNVPRFGSVREACGAAAKAEIDNVAVYDRYMNEDLPTDVRRVFENNRAASLNNHLPAFQRCS